MSLLSRLAAAWTSAWMHLVPPLPNPTVSPVAPDDAAPPDDIDERHLRVLMSHWF